jgi:hypothetical protein
MDLDPDAVQRELQAVELASAEVRGNCRAFWALHIVVARFHAEKEHRHVDIRTAQL